MGVATGCGCKEVYRFPHSTYPYILLLYLFFLQQHPYFLFIFLNVFRSFKYSSLSQPFHENAYLNLEQNMISSLGKLHK